MNIEFLVPDAQHPGTFTVRPIKRPTPAHVQVSTQPAWIHRKSTAAYAGKLSSSFLWATTTKMNLSNYNKDGSPEAPPCRRKGMREARLQKKRAWGRQDWSEPNSLGFGLHMFEWFLMCTHRDIPLQPSVESQLCLELPTTPRKRPEQQVTLQPRQCLPRRLLRKHWETWCGWDA